VRAHFSEARSEFAFGLPRIESCSPEATFPSRKLDHSMMLPRRIRRALFRRYASLSPLRARPSAGAEISAEFDFFPSSALPCLPHEASQPFAEIFLHGIFPGQGNRLYRIIRSPPSTRAMSKINVGMNYSVEVASSRLVRASA